MDDLSRTAIKHKAVSRRLLGDIESGRYVHKLPSIRQMAEDYSVNFKTLMKSLTELERKGVLKTKRGKGVFLNERFINSRSLVLWLISEKWGLNFGYLRSAFLTGIDNVFSELGYDLEIRMLDVKFFRKRGFENMFTEGREAVVTTGISMAGKGLIRKIMEQGVPCISLMYRVKGFNYIDADHVGGFRAIVSHLMELGHRNIVMLASDRNVPNFRDNKLGFIKAFRERGLKCGREFIFDVPYNSSSRLERAVRRVFEKFPGTSAIVCNGDSLALKVLEILESLGKKVPDDVSVSGFDGVPETELSNPRVTTAVQPFYEVGRAAAFALDGLIRGTVDEPVEKVLPVELRFRESTAKPKNHVIF